MIVGGVAGGASAATRLRRLDEDARIILLERGQYVSFANCGLPYYIGGEIRDRDALTVQTPQDFEEKFDIEVRTGNEAVAIDTEKKTVRIRETETGEVYEEGYDKLILSMGAEPVRPPIPGADSDKVFTLRTIPDTMKIKGYIERETPKHAVVMGGGFIGVEMAENLRQAGLAVTLVEMAPQVLAPIDSDMAADVHRHMISKGVRLVLGRGVAAVEEAGERLRVVLTAAGEKGSEKESFETDMLIMAVGVRPESGIAKAAGISVNERGAIVTDERMQTSDADIYAVGDAVEITDSVTGQKGYVPLAGPANKQGRIAADNICGGDSRYPGTQGSSILKVFDMTVASTGVNEKTAKRLGIKYDKAYTYSGNHAGYYPGAVNMAIKVLFDPADGRLLGAQIVGYDGVDKRCDVMATAIRAGMTGQELAKLELCYAPPYGSAKDPVNMAGFVIENLVTGKVKQIHWHDVGELPRDGSATLIDVRSELEFENGKIEGFRNLPLTELRSRLTELDPEKPVYISCQIGLKAYAAARIFSQRGYDAAFIAGGYRLYNSIYGQWPVLPEDKEEAAPTLQSDCVESRVIIVDACGMQCPGPIVKLSKALNEAAAGDVIEISTSDPAFAGDIEGFCRRTGHGLLAMQCEGGISTVRIRKGGGPEAAPAACRTTGMENGGPTGGSKNLIVFSGDLDKAVASFIIANAAAAMGRKVSMFFTFWGLNILRKPEKARLKKDFLSRMFGAMMPRGSQKLGLSKMNMGGMGAKMIRGVMEKKNIDSLEDLIRMAQENGVALVACSMSMDVMGIRQEELIDGVKLGGAAAMLANAEESDMSLFI